MMLYKQQLKELHVIVAVLPSEVMHLDIPTATQMFYKIPCRSLPDLSEDFFQTSSSNVSHLPDVHIRFYMVITYICTHKYPRGLHNSFCIGWLFSTSSLLFRKPTSLQTVHLHTVHGLKNSHLIIESLWDSASMGVSQPTASMVTQRTKKFEGNQFMGQCMFSHFQAYNN